MLTAALSPRSSIHTLVSGQLAVHHLFAETPLSNPACRRPRFSALFLYLDSSASPLLPLFVARLTYVLRGTENPPAITSKEGTWYKMSDAQMGQRKKEKRIDRMVVEIDTY